MNYDPPHLLPSAALVARGYLLPRNPVSNAALRISLDLFLPVSMSLAISLVLPFFSSLVRSVDVCTPFSSFISGRSLLQSPSHLRRNEGLSEGLRSSCWLAGNAVPDVARTLRMVTKGAPTALSLREFPDELYCYLHASEATPAASAMAARRTDGTVSIGDTTRLQR